MFLFCVTTLGGTVSSGTFSIKFKKNKCLLSLPFFKKDGDIMSEIIKTRLKESEGKEILIFLQNNFRFTGKCLKSDEEYLEMLD